MAAFGLVDTLSTSRVIRGERGEELGGGKAYIQIACMTL